MQDTRDKQKVELKTKQVNGRGGAPALMHCPAAVEAAPNPEKRGEYAHTPSGPYSAAARAPLSRTARSALDKVRVLFKQHHHLLQQTSFLMYSSTQLYEGPPHGAKGLAAGMEAVLTGISCMLFAYILLSVLWLSSTGRSWLRWPPSRFSLGPAWAVRF